MAVVRRPRSGLPNRIRFQDDLIQAERDIQRRVGDLQLDFVSMAVVSNLYRAAGAIRNHMERTVLAQYSLSWTAFVTLFVLWIWGDMEARHLAHEANVSKGTLTGVVNTLEKRGLCFRRRHDEDRRLITIGLTARGKATIRRLFPAFNAQESYVTSGLSERAKREVAAGLRTILRTLDGAGEDGGRR